VSHSDHAIAHCYCYDELQSTQSQRSYYKVVVLISTAAAAAATAVVDDTTSNGHALTLLLPLCLAAVQV
jgi:hypothetical protein